MGVFKSPIIGNIRWRWKMSEQKAKGTMLLDFVKMIRKNRQLNWNQYLKPEDWSIVNSKILPGVWYPADVFTRCSMATFHLMGKDRLETARRNGQIIAGHMFESTYKSLLQNKDPEKGLNQFVLIFGSLFNFTLLKVESLEPGHARFCHIYAFEEKTTIFNKRAFAYQLMGFLETVAAMTGGKKIKAAVVSKEWEGAPETIFDITWE
jgi:hypothetical protein